MTLDRTYIIAEDTDELLDLRILRSIDNENIYIHHNGGTKMISIQTAMKWRAALMAILSGSFDRAITETALRMETERAASRQREIDRATTTPTYVPQPKLENL